MTAMIFIKLTGVVCVLLCGYLVGNEKILKLKQKRLLHSDLLRLLELLEENFRYRKDPLPQFLDSLDRTLCFDLLVLPRQGSAQDFSGYRNSLAEDWPQKALLSQQAAEGWGRIWSQMGTSAGEEEAERLEWYRVILQKGLKQAEEKEREAARLYRSVGLTAAAVLAVLLL